MTKYFVIGLNKSGTTSIKDALELSLGLKPSFPIILKMFEEKKFHFDSKGVKYILKFTDFLIKNYNLTIFKDRPWNTGCYKELNQKYNDAKFILTIRDQEEWWNSVENWLSLKAKWAKNLDQDLKNKNLTWKIKEYNTHFDSDSFNKDNYINYYNTYNNSVLEYFKSNPNFYVLYLSKDFNWINIQKIINFDENTMRDNIKKFSKIKNLNVSNNFDGKINDWEFLKSNQNHLT
jgi:hypothetical protein